MNKAEFVAALAHHTSVEQKTVSQVLEGMEDVIGATVKKGEKVMLTARPAFSRGEPQGDYRRLAGTRAMVPPPPVARR